MRITESTLRRIINEAILEGHFKKLYHVSDQAGIQRFRGRWSPKIMMKGIFAAPEKNAIYRSWASYVAGKKFPKDERPSGEKAWYDNLTLYTLAVPNDIYRKIEKVIPKAMSIHQEMGKVLLSGAWGWDAEVFIPEEYLDQIKIIGRETLPTREFEKRNNAIRFNDPVKLQKGPVRLAREELSDFLADALLKNQVSPDAMKFIKTKVFGIFDERIPVSMKGEYVPEFGPEYGNKVWKDKLVLSPSEKKILQSALQEAKDLLLSILKISQEEINKSVEEEEKRKSRKEREELRSSILKIDQNKTKNWRGVSLGAPVLPHTRTGKT